MQLFKKKVYTLYYDEDTPVGPTVDAILWDFSYVSTPYTTSHVLSISAPGNSPVNASITSNGVITTWVGSDINIEVLAANGDASEIYSSITVTRQLKVSPYTNELVNTAGGECIVTNNNINLTIPDYDPAYQYIISGIVEPCIVPTTCTCYIITNIGYIDVPGEEEPTIVGLNYSYISCEGMPTLGVLPLVENSINICARTGTVEIVSGDPGTIELSLTDCCAE